MAIQEGRVSNCMGVPIPHWIIKQLDKRSTENSRVNRDTDNVRYQGNKTAWVRLVSSVNVDSPADRRYFSQDLGVNLKQEPDLAKKFILQGGTSIYSETNNSFSYSLREGFSDVYNVTGGQEILDFGYKPMPGITSVRVQTQGRMGSIRSAEVQIKVWDKYQLDIIDALYFKLGYTMLLEWGHTFYYKSDSNKLESSELFTINPFADNLTKEKIYFQISKNIRESDGNYDAMLGLVTNFNFTYSQDGGYDCVIKLQALGVLAESIKINNPRILPKLSNSVIKQLVKTLIRTVNDNINNQNTTDTTTITTTRDPNTFTADSLIENLKNQKDQGSTYQKLGQFSITYPSDAETYTLTNAIAENIKQNEVNSKYYDYYFSSTKDYGRIFIIRKLNGFIGLNFLNQTTFKFNGSYFYRILDSLKIDFTDESRNPNIYTKDSNWNGKKSRIIKLDYYSTTNKRYTIEIERENIATYSGKDLISSIDPGELPIEDFEFGKKLYGIIPKNIENDTNNYNIKDFYFDEQSRNIVIEFEAPLQFSKDTYVYKEETVGEEELNTRKVKISTIEPRNYRLNVRFKIQDSALIQSFKVSKSGVTQPIDFLTYEKQLSDQNIQQAPPPAEPEPALVVSDIQKSEALKYQSAFEVMVRTLQLYSLDQAINTNDIEKQKKVSVLKITDGKKKNENYKKFLKELFSTGLFSEYIDKLLDEDRNILKKQCEEYDAGTLDEESQIMLRSKFGFHFGLMGNNVTATQLFENYADIDFSELMSTYTVPYNFNQGVFEGTQLNHPTYLPLGFVIMIINQICNIYDVKQDSKKTTPLVYFDFNHKTNICLSTPKQLTTNPYDILIPFEGEDSDYREIIEPLVLDNENKSKIKGTQEDKVQTPLFLPSAEDRLSVSLLKFKLDKNSQDDTNSYRGKTMNILISADYLLRVVATYAKNDGSNDIYASPFIEQILFDVNKYLGDYNMFRLAYDDYGNTMHIVDDQMSPNLEGNYITSINKNQANTETNSQSNKSVIPLFGSGSIARSIEIRSEVSTKLANMLAISANSKNQSQASLSKDSTSFGFYNRAYVDRYVSTRSDIAKDEKQSTDPMINSSIQFNQAIKSFYSDTTPADTSVSHATNYYIERMSKIKADDVASRASAVIPVSLNFSIDGISGFAMGQAFTVSDMLLPYTYDLSKRDFEGNIDKINTVGFVTVGLDQVIEGNQWISNVRANMLYLKKIEDFKSKKLRSQYAPAKSFETTESPSSAIDQYSAPQSYSNYPIVQSNKYSNIKFGKGPLGSPAEENINPKLLEEINSAAILAKTTVTITTGISGHKNLAASGNISRHTSGNAVDIAIVGDVPVSRNAGNRTTIDEFVNQLIGKDYVKNIESGKNKSVLTFGFEGHDNHIHVSINPNIS